jgi:predicted transcriptional regulator
MKQGQRTDLEHSANLPNVAISQESAAKALNVSPRAVRDAKFVKENAPEVYEKIGTKDETGKEFTVNKAKEQIKAKAQEEEEEKYVDPMAVYIGGLFASGVLGLGC